MRPVSAQFLASLRHSGLVVASCDLWFPGAATPITLPLQGGDVTLDRTAASRRTGSCLIPWSLRAGADLGVDLRTLPLGGYAVVRRGLRYSDGTSELVQLGVFRVESVTWRTLEGTASLELADRMAQVRDEAFMQPYSPAAGTEVSLAGTLTHNSPTVTGLSSTTGLLAGMTVSGRGVQLGTRVLTVDSPTQLTLDRPALLTVVKRSPGIYTVSTRFEVPDIVGLWPGMSVSIEGAFPPGFPPGTVITSFPSSIEVAVNQAIVAYPEVYDVDVTFVSSTPTQSLVFGGGRRIADAAVEVVYAVFGSRIEYVKLYDPAIITSDVYYTGSRVAALTDLAAAAAAVQYFDSNGNYVFDRPPDLTGEPVWTIDAGTGGVLIDADESFDRTSTFNGVIVRGQQSADQPPVSALVTDNDPASPTRWDGPFGKVVRIEESAAVQTSEQAAAAAQAILDGQLTLSRSLTLTAAPNPAIEPGDVIRVLFPDGRDERHVIDAVTVGLAPDSDQTLATRSIYAPAAGELQVPPPPRRHGVYYGAAAWYEARSAVPA